MKYCPKCGTALEDSAKFCHSCGTSADNLSTPQPISNSSAGSKPTGTQKRLWGIAAKFPDIAAGKKVK